MSEYELRKEGRRCMKLETGCQDMNWTKQDQHIGLWHLATNKTCDAVTKKKKDRYLEQSISLHF
jgi:hypothetical protein